MDRVNKVLAVALLLFFALTIVLIGLAQAGYVHPVAALASFCVLPVAWFAIKVVDCCRHHTASKSGIDIDSYDEIQMPRIRQRRNRTHGSDSD